MNRSITYGVILNDQLLHVQAQLQCWEDLCSCVCVLFAHELCSFRMCDETGVALSQNLGSAYLGRGCRVDPSTSVGSM